MRKLNPENALIGAAIILTVIGLFDVNLAMIIGCVGIPGSLWILVGAIRNIDCRKPRTRWLTAIGSLILFSAGPTGLTVNAMRVERTFKPVISELTQFKTDHGVYPKTLAELGLEEVPMCPDPKLNVLYFLGKSNKEYFLTCATFGFNKHTFSSKTQTWEDWD